MLKRIGAVFLAVAICLSFAGCGQQAAGNGGADDDGTSRTFTDLIGREVKVPDVPSRIAAITGPSYEMVFMLGGADRIALTKTGHTTNFPVALLTNPELANLAGIGANPSSSVNIEDYLSRGIDLVLYYDNSNELKKFDAVGMSAIVMSLNTGLLESLEDVKAQSLGDYIYNSTLAVNTLAEVLGGDSVAKAKKWTNYCTEKITMLYERTRDIPDADRPTVYWGNTWGESIQSSYALKNRYYEIWLCGGTLLGPVSGNGNFPEVTAEQLFDWDPEIILVDNHGNYPELVIASMYKENSRWAPLSAVKNQRLYRIPAGVFFLDKGTTTALMLLWLATITQPDIFGDIDVVEEIQYYYREFYDFELTDEQAHKVIDGWYERVGDEADT